MLSQADNDNLTTPIPSPRVTKHDTLRKLSLLVASVENNTPPSLEAPTEFLEDEIQFKKEKTLSLYANSLLNNGLMHEFWARRPDCHVAAMAFLLEGLKQSDRKILWVISAKLASEHGIPYGPGLLGHGIDPERIILVNAQSDQDALWAMDEGLKAGSLAAVVGETQGMPLKASRRLSLTAKENKTHCLHLIRGASAPASATYSRWLTSSSPSISDTDGLPGPPRLTIRPVKHRKGLSPIEKSLEWQNETYHFHLASPLANRPLEQSQTIRSVG